MWEITGAEFTQSEAHTADGISIRFPRCTRFRDDKSWKEATDLPLLKVGDPCLYDDLLFDIEAAIYFFQFSVTYFKL